MIHFLSTRAHEYTWRRSIEHAYTLGDPVIKRELLGRVTLLSYEELFTRRELAPGTYVFSDLERLTPRETEQAALYWQTLAEAGPSVRLVNHPILSMRRFELLRHLHAAGINRFDAQRLIEPLRLQRFPVFIRSESGHFEEDLSPLLCNPEEIDGVAAQWAESGRNREDKIIVEFVDVSDGAGTFHKYNAHIAGQEIIALGRSEAGSWVVKELAHIPEKQEALARHRAEHGPALLDVMQRARMDFGRIDYALLEGRIQVFEINSNPTIGPAPILLDIVRALDTATPSRRPIKVTRSYRVKRDEKPRRGRPYRISRRIYLVLDRLGLLRLEPLVLELAHLVNRLIPSRRSRRRRKPANAQREGAH
jgi:hypothetical protein